MQSSSSSAHSSISKQLSTHLQYHHLLWHFCHLSLTRLSLGFNFFSLVIKHRSSFIELFEHLFSGFMFIAGDEVESEGVFMLRIGTYRSMFQLSKWVLFNHSCYFALNYFLAYWDCFLSCLSFLLLGRFCVYFLLMFRYELENIVKVVVCIGILSSLF